jgi:hypothetical protein
VCRQHSRLLIILTFGDNININFKNKNNNCYISIYHHMTPRDRQSNTGFTMNGSSSSLNATKKEKKSKRRVSTKTTTSSSSSKPPKITPNPNKKKADPNHVPRTPDEMVAILEAEMKELKATVKAEFKEMVAAEKNIEAKIKEAKERHRGEMLKKMKGNELVPRGTLRASGFDDDVIIEYMEGEVRKWKKKVKVTKTDKDNVSSNIQQMIDLNKQSEQAVSGASNVTRQLIVDHEVAKTLCTEAEIELYGQEELLKHRKNVVGVDIDTKGSSRKAIKEIVKLMNDRCKDQKLLRDVLKVAGRTLSQDLGMSSHSQSSSDSSSVSSDSDSDNDDDDDGEDGDAVSAATSVSISSAYESSSSSSSSGIV